MKARTKILRACLVAVLILSIFAFFPVPIQHARAFSNNQLWNVNFDDHTCNANPEVLSFSQVSTAQDGLILVIGAKLQISISSITDNLGDFWARAVSISQAAPYSDDNEIWYSPSANAGTLTTLTITWSSNPASCLGLLSQYDTGPISASGIDFFSNINNAGYVSGGAVADVGVSANVCAACLNIGSEYSWTTAGVTGMSPQEPCGPSTVNCFNSAHNGLWTTGRTVGPTSPTTCNGLFICEGTAFFFSNSAIVSTAMFGVITNNQVGTTTYSTFVQMSFNTGQAITIPSTTQIIGCISHNATAFAGTQNAIYYIEGQMAPQGGTLTNMTAYLSAIATATVTMQIAVYVASIPNNPTPGYGTQAFAISQGSYANNVPVTAGTVKFSATISVAVPGNTYFLIAIAQVDSGSGTFKFLEATNGMTFYKTTALGVGALPAQINVAGTSSSSHPPCISGYALLAPVTIQPVTTTTITQGTGTTTVTSTSSLLINAASPTSLQFWIIPFFYMFAPAAILLAIAAVFKFGPGSTRRV